jgi:pilus assembly protein CpaB
MKRKLLVAVLLAVIAVGSLYLYSLSLQNEVAGGQKVTILVAAQDIEVGQRITKANLAQRQVPEAYVGQGTVKRGGESVVLGRQVTVKISQGDPILWSDFDIQRPGATKRLSAVVQKGQRALTIGVDLSGSLAGMLRPGDHIDLMGTFAKGQGTDWATVTLLQNVLVVATGDLRGGAESDVESSSSNAPPRGFTSITVSVDPEEAELLVFAMQRGPVNVALRSAEDIETVEDLPDKNFGDIFESQKRAAFVRRHAAKKIEALKAQ